MTISLDTDQRYRFSARFIDYKWSVKVWRASDGEAIMELAVDLEAEGTRTSELVGGEARVLPD